MDTGAPLVCFGATVTLRGPGGERTVPIGELWTGPGKTSARADELLVAVDMLAPASGTGSAYVRLEYRRQMEIAVVGAAVVVALADGRVSDSRIAITALAPTIRRVPAAEAALLGSTADEAAIAVAAREAAAASAPISDVRASDWYRRELVHNMLKRVISHVGKL
jgi:CO/xanthine dehydrogenase FAD-binding subunit